MALTHVRAYLNAPANAVGLAVRRRVAWRRGPPALVDEPKDDLFGYLPERHRARAEARERELHARYDLEPLRACSRRIDYQENLYLLDALETALPEITLPPVCAAVDVGAKNWSYVFALERFLRRAGALELDLCGVEIDAHAVYGNLRSRYDYAQAYIAQTGSALRFLAADVLDVDEGPQDLITCFYPFLTRYALLQWGLPLGCYRPEAILTRIRDLLRPHGRAVVFTQTEQEADLLADLLPPGLTIESSVPLRSGLVPYWERTWQRRAAVLRRFPSP